MNKQMAKGTTIGCKRKVRNKIRLAKEGSDESDEDYKESEDEEFDESEDEYCSSLVGDGSEESLGEYTDDEDDEEDEALIRKKAKKVGRPKTRKSRQAKKKKNNKNVIRSTKRKPKDDEEEDDYEDAYDYFDVKERKKDKDFNREEEDHDADILSEEGDEFEDEKPEKRSEVSRATVRNTSYRNPRKRNRITLREENEDGDYDDKDDVEFALDDAFERVPRRTRMKRNVVTRQNRADTLTDFNDDKTTKLTKKKRTGRGGGRRRKYSVNSDSDIASSGSSDFDFSISEEEREHVREGNELCGGLTISLRSSSPLRTKYEEAQIKIPVKKGKEKVSDMKVEVVKQVCGICLSEEGKRRVRGALNCCSHYFCFACIMEWSKVESRCPLCKQRFTLINRKVRSDGARDLRDAVFHVPERDQVYQPSEEELRGYLDPYESVLCTECLLGGDDALMLLCDLCDSPAHTYCVGLGHEAPEGNWYCDGCRPAANVSSSDLQTVNLATITHDNRGTVDNFSVNSSSPTTTVRETFDLNEAYVPETPQTSGFSQSPRTSIADHQSYASGYAAPTVFERRRIQRQIHEFRNRDRSRLAISAQRINLFGSRIGPSTSVVMTEYDYSPSSFYASTSSRQSGLMRGQGNGASFAHHQRHPCNGVSSSSNNGTDVREVSVPSSRMLHDHF